MKWLDNLPERYEPERTWLNRRLWPVLYWMDAHIELMIVSAAIGVFIALLVIMANAPNVVCLNGYTFASSPYGYEQILDVHGNGTFQPTLKGIKTYCKVVLPK